MRPRQRIHFVVAVQALSHRARQLVARHTPRQQAVAAKHTLDDRQQLGVYRQRLVAGAVQQQVVDAHPVVVDPVDRDMAGPRQALDDGCGVGDDGR
ncbi:Uncharacterised protein [Mycobacterium tuberculosis]|uniref:Uncharacterized protein n=1 Tax=Mycobacterium tuberculosis TaxID=1773 RepID=A0A916L9D5_MYCTX|nr:Uncharacterised protein [Mycobacterium tuberculosis]CNL90942.1 Uncharacterised protein [Mycobacterium tuberculosis]CNL95298.1 Uncharacterised protein [Mycobacterium tuberculosis]CNM82103.1 Uncharacterised protein [Mycobacterium tuberculosis]COX30835.1 Uncharacterised protein [Mycobacterium tuberculosis]